MADSAPVKTMTPNEAFYRHFTQRFDEICSKIESLRESPNLTPGPDRENRINKCLADIVELQEESQDAATYIPTYDQQSYAASIKELYTKLEQIKALAAPKPKFSFKRGGGSLTARKKPALGASEGATTEMESPPQKSDQAPIASANRVVLTSENPALIQLPDDLFDPFPNIHLEKIHHCVVNLRISEKRQRQSVTLPSVTLNDLSQSIILLPKIAGAIHLTGLQNCLVGIQSCVQFRMHHCHHVRVFMFCSSKPIVEGVTDVGFAPFPKTLEEASSGNAGQQQELEPNLYDQVQDFLWLKATQSPHWHLIPAEEQEKIAEKGWSVVTALSATTQAGDLEARIENILKTPGVSLRD